MSKAPLILAAEATGFDAAARDINKVSSALDRSQRKMAAANDAGKKLQGQFRLMRGGLGQVGHQIQDVAVQLSMGQNAMLVFGQQGSQIASLFGANGAIIGAVLAVGAAVGVGLTGAFKSAKEKMSDLESSISSISTLMSTNAATSADILSEKFIKLAKANRDLAELQLKVKYVQALNNVTTAQALMAESSSDLIFQQYKTGNAVRGNANILARHAKEMGISKEQALALRAATIDLRGGVEGSADSFIKLANNIVATGAGSPELFKVLTPVLEIALKLKEGTEQAEFLKEAMADLSTAINNSETSGQVSQLEKLVEGYEEQALAIRKTARELALYKAAQLNAGFEEVMRINRAFDLIEAEENRKKGIKDTTAALKVQAKAMRQSEKVMEGLASGMADAIIKAENMKDAFRGMAASIVQDMLKIYLKQQLLGLVGMLATAPTAMKYGTNIGSQQTQMLMAQDAGLPGFAGGGFTGRGSRSGGLDGKGGFLATLHPNETVVDHTKGQGMGESIVVNLNISTGVAQTVRAEMMNLLPQITSATKSAVVDARMRGGNYSRSLVGA